MFALPPRLVKGLIGPDRRQRSDCDVSEPSPEPVAEPIENENRPVARCHPTDSGPAVL